MAITGSKNKSALTYDISYGFLGGPAHSRKLRELLAAQGLTPVKPSAEPDIIIAHSGGCWLIPEASLARLVIFIGMPLAHDNPRHIYWQVNRQNVLAAAKGLKLMKLLDGIIFNLYYALTQPRRNRAIMRQVRDPRPSILPQASHVFIANQHDPWPASKQLDDLLKTQDWAFIGLPGAHNDIWEHPDRYAAIINHYARLLA
jgi:hypothetical protein